MARSQASIQPPRLERREPVNPELHKKKDCRYCGKDLPEAFLALGSQPLANSFLSAEEAGKPEFQCPLSLTWCPHCGLVQLTHVVPAELMFSNYLYVSSTTQTFKVHFAEYAKQAKARLRSTQKGDQRIAVDIGSNDGLLLSCYEKEGFKAVGVEPAANLAADANERGLATVQDYFGERAVRKILADYGPADIISANNVFAHIDDIHSVCRNVRDLLSPHGIFIIEFPYLVTMVEEMLFDMIYHEHLSYIAVNSLKVLLGQFGLEIFAIEQVSSHGGSLRVFIEKKGGGYPVSPEVTELSKKEIGGGYSTFKCYQDFSGRVMGVKEKLIRFVKEIQASGKTISGYGAPAKGNTLINFCGFTPAEIRYIVDDNPLKQGLLTPGARIPVVPSKHLEEHPTDYVLIFAWNFAPEIMKKLEPLKKKGVKFIVPLPEPKII